MRRLREIDGVDLVPAERPCPPALPIDEAALVKKDAEARGKKSPQHPGGTDKEANHRRQEDLPAIEGVRIAEHEHARADKHRSNDQTQKLLERACAVHVDQFAEVVLVGDMMFIHRIAPFTTSRS